MDKAITESELEAWLTKHGLRSLGLFIGCKANQLNRDHSPMLKKALQTIFWKSLKKQIESSENIMQRCRSRTSRFLQSSSAMMEFLVSNLRSRSLQIKNADSSLLSPHKRVKLNPNNGGDQRDYKTQTNTHQPEQVHHVRLIMGLRSRMASLETSRALLDSCFELLKGTSKRRQQIERQQQVRCEKLFWKQCKSQIDRLAKQLQRDKAFAGNGQDNLRSEACGVCALDECVDEDDVLVYCDTQTCQQMVHKNCLGIEKEALDKEVWFCPNCDRSQIYKKSADVLIKLFEHFNVSESKRYFRPPRSSVSGQRKLSIRNSQRPNSNATSKRPPRRKKRKNKKKSRLSFSVPSSHTIKNILSLIPEDSNSAKPLESELETTLTNFYNRFKQTEIGANFKLIIPERFPDWSKFKKRRCRPARRNRTKPKIAKKKSPEAQTHDQNSNMRDILKKIVEPLFTKMKPENQASSKGIISPAQLECNKQHIVSPKDSERCQNPKIHLHDLKSEMSKKGFEMIDLTKLSETKKPNLNHQSLSKETSQVKKICNSKDMMPDGQSDIAQYRLSASDIKTKKPSLKNTLNRLKVKEEAQANQNHNTETLFKTELGIINGSLKNVQNRNQNESCIDLRLKTGRSKMKTSTQKSLSQHFERPKQEKKDLLCGSIEMIENDKKKNQNWGKIQMKMGNLLSKKIPKNIQSQSNNILGESVTLPEKFSGQNKEKKIATLNESSDKKIFKNNENISENEKVQDKKSPKLISLPKKSDYESSKPDQNLEYNDQIISKDQPKNVFKNDIKTVNFAEKEGIPVESEKIEKFLTKNSEEISSRRSKTFGHQDQILQNQSLVQNREGTLKKSQIDPNNLKNENLFSESSKTEHKLPKKSESQFKFKSQINQNFESKDESESKSKDQTKPDWEKKKFKKRFKRGMQSLIRIQDLISKQKSKPTENKNQINFVKSDSLEFSCQSEKSEKSKIESKNLALKDQNNEKFLSINDQEISIKSKNKVILEKDDKLNKNSEKSIISIRQHNIRVEKSENKSELISGESNHNQFAIQKSDLIESKSLKSQSSKNLFEEIKNSKNDLNSDIEKEDVESIKIQEEEQENEASKTEKSESEANPSSEKSQSRIQNKKDTLSVEKEDSSQNKISETESSNSEKKRVSQKSSEKESQSKKSESEEIESDSSITSESDGFKSKGFVSGGFFSNLMARPNEENPKTETKKEPQHEKIQEKVKSEFEITESKKSFNHENSRNSKNSPSQKSKAQSCKSNKNSNSEKNDQPNISISLDGFQDNKSDSRSNHISKNYNQNEVSKSFSQSQKFIKINENKSIIHNDSKSQKVQAVKEKSEEKIVDSSIKKSFVSKKLSESMKSNQKKDESQKSVNIEDPKSDKANFDSQITHNIKNPKNSNSLMELQAKSKNKNQHSHKSQDLQKNFNLIEAKSQISTFTKNLEIQDFQSENEICPLPILNNNMIEKTQTEINSPNLQISRLDFVKFKNSTIKYENGDSQLNSKINPKKSVEHINSKEISQNEFLDIQEEIKEPNPKSESNPKISERLEIEAKSETKQQNDQNQPIEQTEQIKQEKKEQSKSKSHISNKKSTNLEGPNLLSNSSHKSPEKSKNNYEKRVQIIPNEQLSPLDHPISETFFKMTLFGEKKSEKEILVSGQENLESKTQPKIILENNGVDENEIKMVEKKIQNKHKNLEIKECCGNKKFEIDSKNKKINQNVTHKNSEANIDKEIEVSSKKSEKNENFERKEKSQTDNQNINNKNTGQIKNPNINNNNLSHIANQNINKNKICNIENKKINNNNILTTNIKQNLQANQTPSNPSKTNPPQPLPKPTPTRKRTSKRNPSSHELIQKIFNVPEPPCLFCGKEGGLTLPVLGVPHSFGHLSCATWNHSLIIDFQIGGIRFSKEHELFNKIDPVCKIQDFRKDFYFWDERIKLIETQLEKILNPPVDNLIKNLEVLKDMLRKLLKPPSQQKNYRPKKKKEKESLMSKSVVSKEDNGPILGDSRKILFDGKISERKKEILSFEKSSKHKIDNHNNNDFKFSSKNPIYKIKIGPKGKISEKNLPQDSLVKRSFDDEKLEKSTKKLKRVQSESKNLQVINLIHQNKPENQTKNQILETSELKLEIEKESKIESQSSLQNNSNKNLESQNQTEKKPDFRKETHILINNQNQNLEGKSELQRLNVQNKIQQTKNKNLFDVKKNIVKQFHRPNSNLFSQQQESQILGSHIKIKQSPKKIFNQTDSISFQRPKNNLPTQTNPKLNRDILSNPQNPEKPKIFSQLFQLDSNIKKDQKLNYPNRDPKLTTEDQPKSNQSRLPNPQENPRLPTPHSSTNQKPGTKQTPQTQNNLIQISNSHSLNNTLNLNNNQHIRNNVNINYNINIINPICSQSGNININLGFMPIGPQAFHPNFGRSDFSDNGFASHSQSFQNLFKPSATFGQQFGHPGSLGFSGFSGHNMAHVNQNIFLNTPNLSQKLEIPRSSKIKISGNKKNSEIRSFRINKKDFENFGKKIAKPENLLLQDQSNHKNNKSVNKFNTPLLPTKKDKICRSEIKMPPQPQIDLTNQINPVPIFARNSHRLRSKLINWNPNDPCQCLFWPSSQRTVSLLLRNQLLTALEQPLTHLHCKIICHTIHQIRNFIFLSPPKRKHKKRPCNHCKRKYGTPCKVCKRSQGLLIKCHHPKCKGLLHPECARRVFCELIPGSEPEEPNLIYCREHSKGAVFRRVTDIQKSVQKKVLEAANLLKSNTANVQAAKKVLKRDGHFKILKNHFFARYKESLKAKRSLQISDDPSKIGAEQLQDRNTKPEHRSIFSSRREGKRQCRSTFEQKKREMEEQTFQSLTNNVINKETFWFIPQRVSQVHQPKLVWALKKRSEKEFEMSNLQIQM